MAILEVNAVSRDFRTHGDKNGGMALDQVTFQLDRGMILCLLGPSGCGKTTLLRIIAGLESPDGGNVCFDGRDMARVPPHVRRFSMMFQEYALFPHKSVFENVSFGLHMQNRARKEIDRLTLEMLALVGLEGMDNRNVGDLSGGERQRVALARSLAYSPRLVLLDEPLGSLDRELRERLIPDVRRILKRLRVTAVFVTHDQAEALAMADQIAVMNKGTIEQIDTPERLYKHPATPAVARFLGFHNLLDGEILENGGVRTEIGILYPDIDRITPGKHKTVLIRPEAAMPMDTTSFANIKANYSTITGKVKESIFQGPKYRVTLETKNGRLLVFDLPNDGKPPENDHPMRIRLNPNAMVLM